MTTELTQKQKTRLQVLSNRERIQRLLSWSDLQYCEFQYEQGYAWLNHHIAGDEYGIKLLTSHAIFWKWWINHWNRRDLDFLIMVDEVGAVHINAETEYRIEHSVNALNVKPHRVIMEACYAKMMGELMDKEGRAI